MSAWFVIPPLLAYAALVCAAAKFPSIGFNAMSWYGGWLFLTLVWLIFAVTFLQGGRA